MTEVAGERLRAAREGKGLTVEDVAARLRIPARYVTALEAGDLSALPELTFVRGYLKSYARELGLDGDALVAEMVPAVEVRAPRPLLAVDGNGPARKAAGRAPNFRGSRRRLLPLLGWVLTALVVLVVILLLAAGEDEAEPVVETLSAPSLPVPAATESEVAEATEEALPGEAGAPVVTPIRLPLPASVVAGEDGSIENAVSLPSPAAPVVAAQGVAMPRRGLFIRFTGESWVEVRDADSKALHTSVQVAGNVLTLDGKAPLTVTVGNSAMAEVWYNGVRQPHHGSNRVSRIVVGQDSR